MIDNGADPSTADGLGRTPLHFCVEINGSPPFLMSSLIYRGACLDAKDKKGRTPPHYAAMGSAYEGMGMLLVARGADVTVKDSEGKTAFDYLVENNKQEIEKVIRIKLDELKNWSMISRYIIKMKEIDFNDVVRELYYSTIVNKSSLFHLQLWNIIFWLKNDSIISFLNRNW